MNNKNNKVLVFDTEFLGHHKEYIHHILLKANKSDYEYIFCLPNEFEKIINDNDLDWTHSCNVTFTYFDNVKSFDSVSFLSLLKSSYFKSLLLKKYIIKYKPTNIFLISLFSIIPLFPFIVHSNVKVSGIIYQLYLYNWKNSSFIKKMLDVIKYIILTKFKIFDKVYILNSKGVARRLNYIYKTDKFIYLPDPFVEIEYKEIDLSKYNINWNNNIYFQFGELSTRKGSLNILRSLSLLNKEIKRKTTLIMLGRVADSIRDEFYNIYNNNKGDMQIILEEGFFHFDLLGTLARKSDIIMLPYNVVNQSSGVISYASQFNTPVLAPSKGMIGSLVKRYKLGYTLETVSPTYIAHFIENFDKKKNKTIPVDYLLDHNVENFIDSIKF